MKDVNLALGYEKLFRSQKNVIPSSGLKVQVYSNRNISQITKDILKTNGFNVIKTINDTFYGKAFFYVLGKFVLRVSKIILAAVILSGCRMLKFVFTFNFFVYILIYFLNARYESLVKKHMIGFSSKTGSETISRGLSYSYPFFVGFF